jgi:FkbM family methyltransferase
MKFIKQILSDFNGLLRVCGLIIATKWLLFIFLTLPQCIKFKNLQPADKLFGEGPIKVKPKYGSVHLLGGQIFSSIREIWVRNVYLKDDFIKIPDEGIVVDLGANVGSFTMQALANSKNCNVIAVEPNEELNRLFSRQIEFNSFSSRVILHRFFIGFRSAKQNQMLNDPLSKDAQFITQKEFIEMNKLSRIDFLKCDIEGSEFDFINDTSLLQITKQLAIEIHDFAGDRNIFIKKLKEFGFLIGPIKDDFGGCILLAKRSV